MLNKRHSSRLGFFSGFLYGSSRIKSCLSLNTTYFVALLGILLEIPRRTSQGFLAARNQLELIPAELYFLNRISEM